MKHVVSRKGTILGNALGLTIFNSFIVIIHLSIINLFVHSSLTLILIVFSRIGACSLTVSCSVSLSLIRYCSCTTFDKRPAPQRFGSFHYSPPSLLSLRHKYIEGHCLPYYSRQRYTFQHTSDDTPSRTRSYRRHYHITVISTWYLTITNDNASKLS